MSSGRRSRARGALWALYGPLLTFPSGAPQALCAAWNAGDRGSMPLVLLSCNWTPPPPKLGSGKPEIPCARMHLENPSIWLRRLADSGVGPGTPADHRLRDDRTRAGNELDRFGETLFKERIVNVHAHHDSVAAQGMVRSELWFHQRSVEQSRPTSLSGGI